jgi:hypothetical protein
MCVEEFGEGLGFERTATDLCQNNAKYSPKMPKKCSPGDSLGTKNEKRLGFNIRGGVERGTWATCCTFAGAWEPSATKKIIAAKPKGQRKKWEG